MTIAQRNNITILGQGERVFVFAHGFGCDQNMWRHVAHRFTGIGRVVLFDNVGAGKSDVAAYDSAKYGDLQGYAADLIEICDSEALKDVILVGHSVSATIGVLAAVARPDLFSKLILICPSPRYANTDSYVGGFAEADIQELLELMDKNHLDWSAVMSPVVMGADGTETLQAEWRDSVCRTDPVIAKEFARVTFTSDHRADYHKVTTPTLMVECSDDALAPPEVGAYLQQAVRGSERVVLQATGHCPHMSAPDAVTQAITDFVVAAAPRADAHRQVA